MWERHENGKTESFPIITDFGKKTDLLKLKSNIVEKIEQNVTFYAESRNGFFSDPQNLQPVNSCPVCDSSSDETEFRVTIYHADYFQCSRCSHIYLKKIPRLEAIEKFYRTNAQYSQTYTNKQAAEFRLNSVDAVLAGHMVSKFRALFGKDPKKVLDIGAGGGHFVEACRRIGMESQGFEFSDSSIAFARDTWGIALDNRDYTGHYQDYTGYDVVTFWGLLEHVPYPVQFIEAATGSLKKDAPRMIMCRVPKWDALSTVVQSYYPGSIVRHLDPLGHIMIYTESSICELFRKVGYKPAAIWYYGMDTYELMMQIGHKTGSYNHLLETGDMQQEIQVFLDSFYLSDLMVLAFIPNEYDQK